NFLNEARDSRDVVDAEYRQCLAGLGMICGDGHDVGIVYGKRCVFARTASACLDLELRFALVALDKHEVAFCQPFENVIERWLLFSSQLVHQCPAQARYDGDFTCAGGAVAIAVGPFLVDVEAVICVLDGGDFPAPPDEFRHKPFREGRFPGILPSGNTKDTVFHALPSPTIRSASARFSGVLMLKKGSVPPSDWKSTA